MSMLLGAKSSTRKTLRFQFLQGSQTEGAPSYSLRPEDSDATSNQLILNALVGTLVKFGNSGRIEPYLASAWSTNEKETEWVFHIRPHLSCEDGEKITADSLRRGLLSSFKRNISKSSKTEFELLKGWQKFTETPSESLYMEGVTAEGNTLKLSFISRPGNLLNYLRMPYFGYWCESNFSNDKFRDDRGFSSSGAYRLSSQDNAGVVLEIRESSFKKQGSPEIIRIEDINLDDLSRDINPTGKIASIGSSYIQLGEITERYEKIQMPPTSLSSIVLKPEGFFRERKNRHAFASRFYQFLSTQKAIASGFKFSDGFYLSSPLPKNRYDTGSYSGEASIQIGFPARPQWDNSRTFYEDAFQHTLGAAGIMYDLLYPLDNTFRTSRDLAQDANIGIRISGVYPGATYDASVIKMMFCSSLGANFPDPSGRICKLVNDTEKDIGKTLLKFNKILVEDACILPFAHDGRQFLVSKDLDLTSLPKSFIYPRFEDVRFH